MKIDSATSNLQIIGMLTLILDWSYTQLLQELLTATVELLSLTVELLSLNVYYLELL